MCGWGTGPRGWTLCGDPWWALTRAFLCFDVATAQRSPSATRCRAPGSLSASLVHYVLLGGSYPGFAQAVTELITTDATVVRSQHPPGRHADHAVTVLRSCSWQLPQQIRRMPCPEEANTADAQPTTARPAFTSLAVSRRGRRPQRGASRPSAWRRRGSTRRSWCRCSGCGARWSVSR